MTRMHEASVEALAKKDGERWLVRSPAPGWFVPAAPAIVTRGEVLGELYVLGRSVRIVAPEVSGVATFTQAQRAPHAVSYGDILLVLDTAAALQAATGASPAAAEAHGTSGLVFRAPTSGRFYGRSSPDKPPFVAVGDELAPGATVCLLEVMKTFHRVTYGGPNLPERARVRELLVADGADVTAGDPLLALEGA